MTGVQVIDLRCEYQQNPLGIDVSNPRLSWRIKPIQSDVRHVMQSAYQIQVVVGQADFELCLWDTGRVESSESVHVAYAGPQLQSNSRYYFRIRVWTITGDDEESVSSWSAPGWWETAFMSHAEWTADWITTKMPRDSSQAEPCLLFRRSFDLKDQIREARVYATALGLYELQLNGMRVSDDLFTPGWTSYHKRQQYQTYDVTKLLNTGTNVIGATLGDGWYKGNLVWRGERNKYGDKSALLCEVHIYYADGSKEVIGTDRQWRTETGPILMSELYHGETYDARLEKDGWSTAEYDDSTWSGTKVLQVDKKQLIAQESLPVRIVEKIKPIAVLHTPSGETVLDMGQNMVGWLSFHVRGTAGTCIRLIHSEVLDKDGNLYMGNLRSAKQTITYTLKDGEQNYEPHFTFQGFRYVLVEGWPDELNIQDFTGNVIYSDLEQTGHFECSNPQLNQLFSNIVWGQKGNFLDIPTDCPQRDERLGWTGDAQVFIRTATYNMNVAPFFAKWLQDLKADQRPDGGVPYVIPNVLRPEDHSSSAWGDAAVICPWMIYKYYADRRVLEDQYESMQAWVNYIREQGDNEFLWNTGIQLGDWLGLDAGADKLTGATAKDLIATAYYAYSTRLMKESAQALGRLEDAAQYEQLHQSIVHHFRQEFVTPNGKLVSQTQTAHILALMFGLLEKKHEQQAADQLACLLKENGIRLMTGFVGTPYICHVLTMYGYNDLAYKLVQQEEYPSWLFSVRQGATTIWEHWDGIKLDGSFWSDSMNSFNHYAYGAVGDWLYSVVGGIDTDEREPGYKHIKLHPQPGEGIDWAHAEVRSMYGLIRSRWKRCSGKLHVDIEIPSNTKATVKLPGARLHDVRESGLELPHVKGLLKVEQADKAVEIEIGSGTYSFSYVV